MPAQQGQHGDCPRPRDAQQNLFDRDHEPVQEKDFDRFERVKVVHIQVFDRVIPEGAGGDRLAFGIFQQQRRELSKHPGQDQQDQNQRRAAMSIHPSAGSGFVYLPHALGKGLA